MSEPKFSVIVPAYNSEEYIFKGLESIRSQSFQNFELIVPCDCCQDRTEKIARSYGAKTFPVGYHHDGLTRNAGLREATGEWVLFMDDDDWFLHEFVFEQLAGAVGRHDEDALMFAYINGKYGYVRQSEKGITSQVWCKCWRREFVEDIHFSIRPNWSDSDFVRTAVRKMRKAAFWDMPLYYWNFMRKGSITQKALSGQIKGGWI